MTKPKKFRADYLDHNMTTWTAIAVVCIVMGIAFAPVTMGVSILFALIGASIAWSRRAVYVSGYKGEQTVKRHLQRLVAGRAIIMHDAFFASNGKTAQIDHLVIGPGGILVIETKNHSGNIYVDPSANDWRQVKVTKAGRVYEKTLYSPIRQNNGHKRAVINTLMSAGLRAPTYSRVVFTSPNATLHYVGDAPEVKYLRDITQADIDLILNPVGESIPFQQVFDVLQSCDKNHTR